LKIKLLFLLLSFTCFHFVQAQITFQKTYGTPKNDWGYGVTQTFDGGYALASVYDSNKIAIIKTDSIGDTTWVKMYPYLIANINWGDFIIQTSDSNYVLVGGAADSSGFMLKVNSIGDTLWLKKLPNNTYMNILHKVIEDKFGNLIVVGETYVGKPTVCCAPIMFKADHLGNTIWSLPINCPYPTGCRLQEVYIDKFDGNYLVTGDAPAYGPPVLRLVKLDTAGKYIWNSVFTSISASISSVISTRDSGYLCTGESWTYDSLPLYKIDKKGNLKFYKGYPDSNSSASVIDTTTGGYLIAGQKHIYSTNYDLFLSKLDTNYNVLWNASFGGSNTEQFGYMKATSDGGAVLVGSTNSFGAGEYDAYLVKTNYKGLITGQNVISVAQNGISISPNPFSQKTIIKTEKNFSNATLTLYNSLGQVVRTLNGITGKEFALNRGNLPPGIYLLRITQEGKVASSKLIIED